MIKRILVALDPDSDTQVATQYAVEIAGRSGAVVTGIAVVDMGSIEASSIGGGIGSMYYAEKLRENLTAETRQKAQELARRFSDYVEGTGVGHAEVVREGVPFRRIVEDMKYHDMLILGNNPHFFYCHPKQHTQTLAKIVEQTIGPTLVVPETYTEVRKILIAYDGTNEAARAVRKFSHLFPFGHDLEIRVLHVHRNDDAESKLMLRMIRSFMEAHGFTLDTMGIISHSVKEKILSQADEFGADLIILGAHTKSGFRGVRLGDATSHLLENSNIPLFIEH